MERMETRLIRELIRAKHINAKRELEALISGGADKALLAEWIGQEIAFKQILDVLDKPAQ